MREVRISPDGNSIAIRSDWPEDHDNAFGVMNAINGGHWAKAEKLESWPVVTLPDLPEEE